MEELLINVNLQGDGDLDKVEKKVEKLGKTTNKTQNEMGKLRKELRDAKSDMLQAEEGSEEYARALARVADIQFRLKDVNDKARLAVRDFGEVAKNTARAVAGLSGGFTATIGVMNLFAGENENLAKAILGVQSALAITQGLATFADSIESMRDLIDGLGLNRTTNDITELGNAATNSADEISKLSSEAAVLGSNLAGTATTNEKLDKGLKGVSESIKNTTSAIGKHKEKLVAADAFLLRFANSNFNTSRLSEISKEYLKNIGLMDRATGQLLVSEQTAGVALSDFSKKMKEFNELTGESEDAIDSQTEAQNKSNESVKKGTSNLTDFGKSIIRSLASMAAFMAIIAGATLIISKFIEKLNEIPEDIKLKLELEENIVADTQKAMEKVAQIKQNITLASNKKELDLIKEKLVSEKIATEKQLKGLNDSKALLSQDFWDEYIENVKSVAENEYLIRRDIELELQKELAVMRFKTAEEARQELIDAGKTGLFQGTMGLNIEMLKAEKEIKNISKQMETFQKTFYNPNGTLKLKPIKFDIGSGGKSTTGTNIDETEIKPDTFLNLGTPTKEQIKNSEKNVESYLKNIFKKANDFIKKSIGKDPDLVEAANTLTTIFEGEIVNVNTPTSTENLQKRFDAIDERRQKFVEDERNAFEKQMELYQSYATSIGTINDAISGIYDARMQVVDNYYNAEAALINNSLLTEEAKNQKLAELDAERYEKQKKLLEAQKAFRIATVGMDLASGLMGIYTSATLPVAAGGMPRPLNWIQGGLEAAALTAQSIASIAQIRAQQLDAPTSSSSGTGLAFAALNPSKSAMTTKEENLNMIQNNANKDYSPVVKVSDINRVQNSVKIREKNSVY